MFYGEMDNNNLFQTEMDNTMLNDWLTDRQEEMVWATMEIYWQGFLVHYRKVEVWGEDRSKVEGRLYLDMISERMFE